MARVDIFSSFNISKKSTEVEIFNNKLSNFHISNFNNFFLRRTDGIKSASIQTNATEADGIVSLYKAPLASPPFILGANSNQLNVQNNNRDLSLSVLEMINKSLNTNGSYNFLTRGHIACENKTIYYRDSNNSSLKTNVSAFKLNVEFRNKNSPNGIDFVLNQTLESLDDTSITINEHAKDLFSNHKQLNSFDFNDNKISVIFLDSAPLLDIACSYTKATTYDRKTYEKFLGNKIFDSSFSLMDQNRMLFDAEGVLTRNSSLKLVESGNLKGILSDLTSSRNLGINSSGNSIIDPFGVKKISGYHLKAIPDTKDLFLLQGELEIACILPLTSGISLTNNNMLFLNGVHCLLLKSGELIGNKVLNLKAPISELFRDRYIGAYTNPYFGSKQLTSICIEMDFA